MMQEALQDWASEFSQSDNALSQTVQVCMCKPSEGQTETCATPPRYTRRHAPFHIHTLCTRYTLGDRFEFELRSIIMRSYVRFKWWEGGRPSKLQRNSVLARGFLFLCQFTLDRQPHDPR